ncbi:DUF2975 domain-containing protein [Gracilibacillus oryzae]|nr:DUF2975 domain-containing protein [Gracilibacillus oryzae]
MSTTEIKRIKSKVKTNSKYVSLITWIVMIYFVFSVVMLIRAAFLPEEAFTATPGLIFWQITIPINAGFSFNINIPMEVLPNYEPERFQAKAAFITYHSIYLLTYTSVLLYGIRQLTYILWSITDGHTPFTINNSVRLRNIAFAAIGNALLAGHIATICISIFVTQIFSMNILNISFSGLIIGSLLLVISQIFRYGAYLQEQYDTTL